MIVFELDNGIIINLDHVVEIPFIADSEGDKSGQGVQIRMSQGYFKNITAEEARRMRNVLRHGYTLLPDKQ